LKDSLKKFSIFWRM